MNDGKKKMSDLKPEISNEVSTTSIVVTGPFNSSLVQEQGILRTYSSSSYTVGAVLEAADNEPLGAPSKPLSGDAVRTLNSVLASRVPDSAFLRDEGGEI